ncbi:MAG TPA: hypothetical protein VMW68_08560 [Methyloceanibacter sp.]|nr:hypothetical protein [Methyloceanibacter sp.]
MATANKFQQFVEDLAHKVHNLGSDQLEVALTVAVPSATLDEVLADITPIDYTNLSARTVTTTSSGHTTGTYNLVLTDLVLTASGGPVASFQYVTLFNQASVTPTDALIMWWDYGSGLILLDTETFTIDFAATTIVIGP